jgi:sugar O-acyltransferase (sialic acid O-acetyltransferase NeuD family)
MKKLLIFPFNGNGIEALDCIQNAFEVIGFVDDEISKQGKSKYGIEVFGRDAISKYKKAFVLALPGSPSSFRTRHDAIGSLNLEQERFATVIHPSASVSAHCNIGRNVLIMAGVVLTSNAIIGNHVCILPNSVIHHDSSVGDYSLVGANVTISGYTSIGRNCYIGSGSSVINNISVADFSLVGMGSNVIRNVTQGSIVAGNPAKEISSKK